MGGINGGLLTPLYSGGILVGTTSNGYLYIPYAGGAGLVMQDANGTNWLMQVGTDGRLTGGVQIVF